MIRCDRAGFWGSAVCSFSVDEINRVFDVGPFKGQQSFETGWFSVPERDVPVPRPGQASPVVCSYIALLSTHAVRHGVDISVTVCVFCVFVRLRISPPRIKLSASYFIRRFTGVQRWESPIFVNFAPQKPKIGRIGKHAAT